MGVENNIYEGWVETTLGNTCELLDCLHRTPKYSNFGYPMVRVTDVKNGPLETNGCLKVDVNTFNDFSKNYQPKIGDIVFTRVGSFGLSAIVKKEEQFCIGQNTTLILAKKINPFFLFYYLISKAGRYQIIALSSGSTQPTISMANIREIHFNLPPLPEQKAIAKVLTTFDDKIELLQAQNKTLETMAQTIFKEWFGKYQIGDDLPDGWRVGEFGEVIEFINGYAFKSKDLSKEPIDNAYKVFKMGDINKGGGFKPGKTKGYYSKSMSTKLNKYILKNGDLLMSMTDMKDAISLLGHTALMIYEDEYIVNQRVGLIRAQNDLNIEYPYLFLLTNNEDFIAGIRAGANSGVQVNLSTQGIKETEFIIADKETNKAFNNVVMPLFDKRKANSQMIKELKKTRDTLLPKLMSGQVRVNNIKQTADA